MFIKFQFAKNSDAADVVSHLSIAYDSINTLKKHHSHRIPPGTKPSTHTACTADIFAAVVAVFHSSSIDGARPNIGTVKPFDSVDALDPGGAAGPGPYAVVIMTLQSVHTLLYQIPLLYQGNLVYQPNHL